MRFIKVALLIQILIKKETRTNSFQMLTCKKTELSIIWRILA